jgi:hypothetical protein
MDAVRGTPSQSTVLARAKTHSKARKASLLANSTNRRRYFGYIRLQITYTFGLPFGRLSRRFHVSICRPAGFR